MTTVQASYDTLLQQAGDTVDVYLRRTVRLLNDEFDDPNYAKNNPALVGQLVAAMAADFSTASFGKVIGELADVIRDKDFVNG